VEELARPQGVLNPAPAFSHTHLVQTIALQPSKGELNERLLPDGQQG
jgi:hypothetical protein